MCTAKKAEANPNSNHLNGRALTSLGDETEAMSNNEERTRENQHVIVDHKRPKDP